MYFVLPLFRACRAARASSHVIMHIVFTIPNRTSEFNEARAIAAES